MPGTLTCQGHGRQDSDALCLDLAGHKLPGETVNGAITFSLLSPGSSPAILAHLSYPTSLLEGDRENLERRWELLTQSGKPSLPQAHTAWPREAQAHPASLEKAQFSYSHREGPGGAEYLRQSMSAPTEPATQREEAGAWVPLAAPLPPVGACVACGLT